MNTHADRFEAAMSKQIAIEMAEREITQKELAEAIGIGRPAMNHYLNGHKSIPMPTFLRIAEALGLSPSVLWTRAEARTQPEEQSA